MGEERGTALHKVSGLTQWKQTAIQTRDEGGKTITEETEEEEERVGNQINRNKTRK
jgi:hypothetical protein